MEYNGYICWIAGTIECHNLNEMYYVLKDTEPNSVKRIEILAEMVGCLLPQYDHEIYSMLKACICRSDTLEWYGIITDKKKYLLAKLKYGI